MHCWEARNLQGALKGNRLHLRLPLVIDCFVSSLHADSSDIVLSVHVCALQSVLARGLHALLPPIEVVKGSYCNANPDNPREWEVRCLVHLSQNVDKRGHSLEGVRSV